VRELLLEHKDLSSAKKRIQGLAWPDEVATDAFKLCGAYIGSVTGLQYAMLIGRDDVAESIVDATLSADIDLTFGGQNTSLHLASLLGAREMVQKLLKRGASQEVGRRGNYSPVSSVEGAD
ncbi:hypothetical protein DFJ74DRAFT_595962, partial [Hyaloraphidium curvatum]